MHIGHISFRLAGTDGVSLEAAKIAQVLYRMGHTNYYFAGELDPQGISTGPITAPVEAGMLVPQAHFTDPEVLWITEHAFNSEKRDPSLLKRIHSLAESLQVALQEFIFTYQIELLIVQNVFAIPMNIALSVAIYQVVQETGIPTIAHNHDFYWERDPLSWSIAVNELFEKCHSAPREIDLQHAGDQPIGSGRTRPGAKACLAEHLWYPTCI